MSDRATWLADVLRAAGLTVHEVQGWRERGRPLRTIHGVVWHHTATGPGWANVRVVDLLVKGRPDLPGPLCQLGLRRDGSFDVIAAGRGNHNGYGTWGNDSIGIEAYNDGAGEAWPAAQIAAYDRGTAAILAHLGLTTAAVKGHKETDPRRKIDPRGIDMDQARQRIASLLTYRPPSPDPGDDTMTPEQEAKLDRLVADVAEIRRQVASSQDATAKGGRTLRHIAASVLNRKG